MDERKRVLATAWRDLAGWHVGMVTDDEDVVLHGAKQTSEIEAGCAWGCAPACGHTDLCEYDLPDPDAPANWGVWLAWLLGRDLEIDIVPQMPRGCGRFAISVGRGRHYVGPFARSLLLATIDGDTDSLSTLPPSVLAWWEAEQVEGDYEDTADEWDWREVKQASPDIEA